MTALSVVIPCYNEAERLPATLAVYLAHLSRVPGAAEVLVVDDGSTDATFAIANAAASRDPRIRVVRTGSNRGKGFAVRFGMLAAAGDRVVFTDADGSYGPSEVDRVAGALADAPIAIGTRDPDAAAGTVTRQVASQVFNRALRVLLGLPYRDTQCGLKGFRRDAAQAVFGRAQLDGFAFDAEVLVLARRLGLAVAEVPVLAQERAGSKVRVLADGRRMLAQLWTIRRTAGKDATAWTGLGGRVFADGVHQRPGAPGAGAQHGT
jgi:glycosyltransferase involved in cell wall biosynthesis